MTVRCNETIRSDKAKQARERQLRKISGKLLDELPEGDAGPAPGVAGSGYAR